ncbi:hypothetical protein QBC44DRAFT_381909 [Cladorrhinum sp. PSN332]|nr:hypothetical protein QBC44DRAFT_381909 [Cladorrhinum sp. PSN332]
MTGREETVPNKRALQALETLVQRWRKPRHVIFEDFNKTPSQAFWVALNSWSRERRLVDYEHVRRLLKAGHGQNPQRGLPRVPSDPSRWLPSDVWAADDLWMAEEVKRAPDAPPPKSLNPKDRRSSSASTGNTLIADPPSSPHVTSTFAPLRSIATATPTATPTATASSVPRFASAAPADQATTASSSSSSSSSPSSSPITAQSITVTASDSTSAAPSQSPPPPPTPTVEESSHKMRTRRSAAQGNMPLNPVTNSPAQASMRSKRTVSEKTAETPSPNPKKRQRIERGSPGPTAPTADPAAATPTPAAELGPTAGPEPVTTPSPTPEPHQEEPVVPGPASAPADDPHHHHHHHHHHHQQQQQQQYRHRHYPQHGEYGFTYDDDDAMHSAVCQSCSHISIQVTELENALATLVKKLEEHQKELTKVEAHIRELDTFLSNAPALQADLEHFLSKVDDEQAQAEKALADFQEWQAKYPVFAKEASDEPMKAKIKKLVDEKSAKEAQLVLLPEEVRSKASTLVHLQGQRQNLYLLIEDRSRKAEMAEIRFHDARDFLDLVSLGPAGFGRIRRAFPPTAEEQDYIDHEVKKVQAPVTFGSN